MKVKTVKDILKASKLLEKWFAPHNASCCAKGRCSDTWVKDYIKETKKLGQVQRGCCYNCAKSRGYFNAFAEQKEIVHLKELFWVDDTYGFFHPTKLSCNIPRPLRSGTCLRYTCGCVLENMGGIKAEKELDSISYAIMAVRNTTPDWVEQTLVAMSEG